MNVRLYVWQRLTAAVMVPLVLVHVALIFYATRRGLTAADILGRTRGSLAWASFYAVFVVAVAVHAGIGVRTVPYDPSRDEATRPSFYCYEIQLLDDAGKKPNKHSSGSLYRYVAPKVNAVKPAPEWNVVEVECVGPRIKVTINDQEVIDVDQTSIPEIRNKPLKGYVCLQNHHGVIDFRNVRIRENPKKSTAEDAETRREECRLSSLCVSLRSLRLE